MLTWRLWRALRYPDEGHPLFLRIAAQQNLIPGGAALRRLEPIYHAVSVIVSALLIIVAPALLLIVSNLLGALVAFNVTNTIDRERQQGTYDLLGVTPDGLGAANWQIAAACTYRLNVIERLASLRSLALTTLILLLVYSLGAVPITPIPVLVLLVALNIDAIQSQVVGCLSGMLAQVFSDTNAVFAALAIFVFSQLILVYLPIVGAALVLYDFMRDLPIHRWLADGIVALVALAALVLVREAIIRVMWRELESRLL